ncbi:NUDIX domain-containing protein [uncultured Pontibacter sp.]|uniref:NUDIX domain-containing protein n=1 Tax=uncultured Pontibacter sp. TaxID=453356 RepID=UPI003420EAD1
MIEVTAGVIQRNGLFLIARRAPGKSLEGYWEFPGGKVEAGETHEYAWPEN